MNRGMWRVASARETQRSLVARSPGRARGPLRGRRAIIKWRVAMEESPGGIHHEYGRNKSPPPGPTLIHPDGPEEFREGEAARDADAGAHAQD